MVNPAGRRDHGSRIDPDTLPIQYFGPIDRADMVVKSINGVESISEPFHFEVDLILQSKPFEFTEVLGRKMTVTIELTEKHKRHVSGVVSHFGEVAPTGTSRTFRATLVPWFSLGKYRRNCRIFQNKTIPEIIDEVLGEMTLADFEFRLDRSYEPLLYCVQYRETDFAFVSRLLEQAGIFYYFAHDDDVARMIMSDSLGGVDDPPGLTEPIFYRPGDDTVIDLPQFDILRQEQAFRPGRHAVSDFNFLDPGTSLLAETTSALEFDGGDKFEFFDYPGDYVGLGKEDGGKLEQADAEALQRKERSDSMSVSVTCHSLVCEACAGYRVTLADYPFDDFNIAYLLTDVTLKASQASYFTNEEHEPLEFENNFTGIPDTTSFRPQCRTPRPRVDGPQTAIVVGPAGEELYTDKHGRVKVQFHWDRYGEKDENSSCWVRVAQNWAGKNWGVIFHPRIGQEVIVDFLEGNPDRPIITGRVYNAEQPIPWQTATQSGILTRSSKDATAENFNEIRFEDKKGSEELHIQAEKNETILVKVDKAESIGNDEERSIGHDQSESVGRNRKCEVGKDRETTIAADETLTVGGERTQNVADDETISIGAAQAVEIGANRELSIGADDTQSVGGKRAAEIAGNEAVKIGGNYSLSADGNGTLKFGKKLTIEAGDQITVKVGSASATLKKDGTITFKGKDLKLDGSGKITVKASKDLTLKGMKIQSN